MCEIFLLKLKLLVLQSVWEVSCSLGLGPANFKSVNHILTVVTRNNHNFSYSKLDSVVLNTYWKFGGNRCMGLVCETPTRFMPAATARTAQVTTITPALGAGIKNMGFFFFLIKQKVYYMVKLWKTFSQNSFCEFITEVFFRFPISLECWSTIWFQLKRFKKATSLYLQKL